ncbi:MULTISPECIES: cobalamin biosynthesis protein [unclassified Neptuniibacter]|uniref:cobalamin biosynthesis protein n=1 Tax=unclassified Neptuniibacter TaxID=2630693 RepID=UPI000C58C44E|nr:MULTISPECIES: cobalamin biosynthesis protein [unclassified Neptuniibacter]MAY42912.1 cobalamin biosynthesis protein CbiG [Oceanospirillaceae bacterium]|tara:strand:+ start:372 stop:1154 length:783 start_codon:yes stop_codon:yes gene_type:complete
MIRIISLTEQGKNLGDKVSSLIEGAVVCHKPQPFITQVQSFFSAGDRLIFICATGIVMRTLAPVLVDKYKDPAVLVLDEQGRFVIPLLSGHEGGANDWALQVADLINAEPVITTANSYLQPKYTVGMGCERNCPEEELERLLMECLAQQGLAIEQVSSLSSIDIKADEVGLISLAAKLGLPYLTWDKTELSSVEAQLSTRSEYVFKTVGVYGVAESAALYSAQQMLLSQTDNEIDAQAELVMNKQKTTKATCAIARVYLA